MTRIRILFVFFLALVATRLNAQKVLLYGGDEAKTFLGCLSCNKFDKESVLNQCPCGAREWRTWWTWGTLIHKPDPTPLPNVYTPVFPLTVILTESR